MNSTAYAMYPKVALIIPVIKNPQPTKIVTIIGIINSFLYLNPFAAIIVINPKEIVIMNNLKLNSSFKNKGSKAKNNKIKNHMIDNTYVASLERIFVIKKTSSYQINRVNTSIYFLAFSGHVNRFALL